MDYEKVEASRYENMWRSTKGRFNPDPKNYKSECPAKELKDFVLFLKSRGAYGKILDIGCGNGRNSVYLAQNGFNVYGVEVSKSALHLAKLLMAKNNVHIAFKRASVFNLPYAKESFDAVIDFGCLHHMRKSQWALYKKNVYNVLKKGGYYFLYCFSSNNSKLKPKKKNWLLIGKHYDHFFSVGELNKLFGKKFKIITKCYSKNNASKMCFICIYLQKSNSANPFAK